MDIKVAKPPVEVKNTKKFTNLIIIDASGSMSSKSLEVIGGIKGLFKTIREDAKANPEIESNTIVIDFSSSNDIRVLLNSKNPADLIDSIAESYCTRGMTALYDAINYAFSLIEKDQDGVFVNILTDGEENDSKECKGSDIKKLIETAKDKKWAVTFMGASEDCIKNAKNIGISNGNTMVFENSSRGITSALNKTVSSRTAYYSAVSNSNLGDFDLENIITNTTDNSGVNSNED